MKEATPEQIVEFLMPVRKEQFDMTDADFLRSAGIDGAKWAAEFRLIAIGLGYSDMDEGWLIGWFANAIEAGRSAGRSEIARLQAEKIEMANAILQIGGLSEMHFRTLVSFEVAEFVFTERLAELKHENR